jgi:uncharacterized membrane protein YqjE
MRRLLWLLPKLAPAVLRHLGAYAELAGQDLAEFQRTVGARLVALAFLALAVFFVLLSGCLLVVALTWDTPHRVAAIIWMGAVFLVAAVVAALIQAGAQRRQAPFLTTVRREWQEDRLIVEQLLSPDEN